MSAKGGVASTSAVGKAKKGGRPREDVGLTYPKKPIELLSKGEFKERFCIPNGISIHLMEGDPMRTEK